MAKIWSFRDFKSERGVNLIHGWLHSQSVAVRADVNALIIWLEIQDVSQFSRPQVGALRDRNGQQCRGLIELRGKKDGVQWRPIGYYGPAALGNKVVTLLAGATERDGMLVPDAVCQTGFARRIVVETNPGRYSCDHDFS